MLQNIEELGRKKGKEEGRDEVLINIMKSGMVNID